jgi:hypothetical protein
VISCITANRRNLSLYLTTLMDGLLGQPVTRYPRKALLRSTKMGKTYSIYMSMLPRYVNQADLRTPTLNL